MTQSHTTNFQKKETHHLSCPRNVTCYEPNSSAHRSWWTSDGRCFYGYLLVATLSSGIHRSFSSHYTQKISTIPRSTGEPLTTLNERCHTLYIYPNGTVGNCNAQNGRALKQPDSFLLHSFRCAQNGYVYCN